MALKFIGERTVGTLNGMKSGFVKDDLYRVYDAGILVPGGVSVDHGDFVSWDGTKWVKEADIKILTTNNLSPDSIPESVSESNPIMTAADTELMILENIIPAANTLRFSFSKLDYSPVVAEVGSSGTWKKVSKYAENNVWDWTKNDTTFANAFENAFQDTDNLVSIIAAGDTSSVTSLSYTFAYCSSIVSFCLFDTSNVTNFAHAFRGIGCETLPKFNLSKATSIQSMLRSCSKLKAIPTFDVAVVTYCNYAFYQDRIVESGSKAFYDALIAQVIPPSDKANCFAYCGDQTTTGAAELAQIPASWGGTYPASLNMGAPQNLDEPLSPSVIDGDDSLTK